jgi:hypothetical protein
MRLFRLTLATIFQRKVWVICAFAVVVLPFLLPMLSSAEEKPHLVQPARIQATWAALWVCTLVWGLFTAAKQGETNARSGVGEYFLTTGTGPVRQLMSIWLAILCFIVPLTLAAAAVTQFGAAPSAAIERSMWWLMNVQYASLFMLVTAPLIALAVALASRFGAVAGFSVALALALYGLYGVGYLDNMLKQEENTILQSLWLFSPQYRFADLTQRLYFKSGALPGPTYFAMLSYFAGIMAVLSAIASMTFRIKSKI